VGVADEYTFIFLTLTCKNISGQELNAQIDKMFAAFKALCLRKRFKKAVRGWVRTFEVTYNWKVREFHPHFHCVLLVDNEYFTSNLYIEQNEWCLLWQSCLSADYKPICHIQVLKESEKGKGKEVAKVAKYAAKPSNILADLREVAVFDEAIQAEAKRISEAITDEIVTVLDEALANRRLMGFGGIFKEKHRELNRSGDDNAGDNEDLIHAGNGDGVKRDVDFEVERYRWNIGLRDYVKMEEEGSV
jgi:plasmid rolling circle replication initiator protein Rep